jgi:pimeloyl-ACP methyl ester carboxylesterase
MSVLKKFLTPSRLKESSIDQAFLATARQNSRGVLDSCIQTYQWGARGSTVLMVHGWGGRAAQFREVVSVLVSCGYSVLAFDAPGHGRSAGTTSSLFQFCTLVRELLVSPELHIQYVVGHSMGAASAAMALARGAHAVRRAALLAPICRLKDVVTRFCNRMGLAGDEEAALVADLEDLFGSDLWAQSSLANIGHRIGIPVLIVHDRDDQEIPLQDGVDTASAFPQSEIVTTEQLGHRAILYDKKVLSGVAEFLERTSGKESACLMRQ